MLVPKRLRAVVALAMLLAASLCVVAGPAATRARAATATETRPVAAPKTPSGEKDFLASLDSSDGKEAEAKESPVYVTALRFIFSLGLVLVLAYATILGLRKFAGLKSSLAPGRQRIRVLENSSLGPNRTLHLVEVGKRKLVIASTPNQVNLITEVSADDLPESVVGEPPAGFRDQLAMFLGARADTTKTVGGLAEMLRESTAFLQAKVRQVGGLRRTFRNAGSE